MKNLSIILKRLKALKHTFTGKYYIPEVWNCWGFTGYSTDEKRKGEICVNPYDFIINCIENNIIPYVKKGGNYLEALNCRNKEDESELSKSVVYSTLPRMFTAWKHDDNKKIYPGTLLKAICLLPCLKNMKVDIICMLPIFEYSDRYKKGEVGSPYAIKNMYKLDRNLHDDLLGENTESFLETEFKAFVEAAHILNIKVMLDFVFRTVSRDNDLIIEHPDWFYWIDLKYAKNFKVPFVEKEKTLTELNDRSLESLYTCTGINEYLSMFTHSPREIDGEKWEKLKAECIKTGKNILDLIEDSYQITTTPGFSDVLNDIQPLWTDVTYLKYYFGVDRKVARYIKNDQMSYILQDSVCLNLYQGPVCNSELWNYVVEIIPYYQKKFGIDGARIDSGHALPAALNRDIIARARAENRNFILWAEEFDTQNTPAAKECGFNFITGMLWSIYKEIESPEFNGHIFKHLMRAAIPVLAALETPDTPRIALVQKDRKKIELLVLLNCFLPNAVVFINNGMEAMEVQPMNLGLENTEDGRYVLKKSDPLYGKLAFFDHYHIHWLDDGIGWMRQLLSRAISLRIRFADIISKRDSFIWQGIDLKNEKITPIIYYDRIIGNGIFLLANRDFNSEVEVDFKALLPLQSAKDCISINLVYLDGELCNMRWSLDKKKWLAPGEVIIGSISSA